MIAGNRTRVDFGNGTWQTFSYGTDARYMSTGIDYAYKCNSATVTGGIRITRTNGGNPLSWADITGNFIKTFSYDTQGRLTSADIPGASRTSYGYDWVGNRTSPTAVYNNADQLTSYNGHNYSYYDYGDGSMMSDGVRTYNYGVDGAPYTITYNGVAYTNGYDPSRNRMWSRIGSVMTKYVYDITASVPATLAEGPENGSTSTYYVREPGGELVMRKNGTDLKYYHFDELGSTLFLTDASGVQTDKYVYNAWGKVVSSSGSTVNPYKFVGRLGYYHDAGTGLYWVGTRFYDPDAGVFTQRDAAKDGLSWYSYTSGHSMVAVDPWGKDWNTASFLYWYKYAEGKPIDLQYIGLLDEYQDATYGDWRMFEEDSITELKKKAAETCNQSVNKGNKDISIYHHMKPVTIYPHVGKEQQTNPLYCIGGNKLKELGGCSAVINCKTRRLTYRCKWYFLMHDLFANPRSVKDKNGNELTEAWPDRDPILNTIPYEIWGHWQDNDEKANVKF